MRLCASALGVGWEAAAAVARRHVATSAHGSERQAVASRQQRGKGSGDVSASLNRRLPGHTVPDGRSFVNSSML